VLSVSLSTLDHLCLEFEKQIGGARAPAAYITIRSIGAPNALVIGAWLGDLAGLWVCVGRFGGGGAAVEP